MSQLSKEIRKELEESELSTVLSCRLLARAPNLSRILLYICERYFQGQTSISEFDIATEALGRRGDFNPLDDATVRVNIHNLRKKLRQYYEEEGACHSIQIELPVGHYLPQFIERTQQGKQISEVAIALLPATQSPIESVAPAPGIEILERVRPGGPSRVWAVAGMSMVLFLVCLAALFPKFRLLEHHFIAFNNGQISPESEVVVRIAAGVPTSHADSAGKIWSEDRWFNGGQTPGFPNMHIGRGADQELYKHSREGKFSYDIPLPRGKYELHLYFAETTYTVESGRSFSISINGKVATSEYDVLVDTGAPNVATAKVFIDVEPAADGKLHIGFEGAPSESQNGLVNGIEILSGTPGRMRPILQAMREEPYVDTLGRHWSSDEWFEGGRIAARGQVISNFPDPNLFATERVGTFNYAIPVVDHHLYKVTLYFSESWFLFAVQPKLGDRIFDVYCNGVALLTNFDIMKTTGIKNEPVIRSFEHVAPNPQGKIALTFVPRVNLATINAIQIEDEGSAN